MRPAQTGYGSLSGLAQARFERAERHSDRVQVRRVFGQVTKCRPTRFNRLSDAGALVCREVVHHHDILAPQGWDQTLFDVGQEFLSCHWTINGT
jgi:hypothetical protein